MFHSSIIGVQFILIGIGVLFQVIAVSTKRKETPAYFHHGQVDADADDEQENRHDVVCVAPKMPARSYVPKKRERDYYEMEKTDPAVRPADLLRTAKVAFINDAKAKPSS